MQALSELTLDDDRIDQARLGLADALEKGDGVEQNLAAAAELYFLLCDRKYSANGALRLAELYLNGQGVGSSRQLAAMWLILGTVPTRDLYPHWHRPARLPARERACELLSQIMLQSRCFRPRIRHKVVIQNSVWQAWSHCRKSTALA